MKHGFVWMMLAAVLLSASCGGRSASDLDASVDHALEFAMSRLSESAVRLAPDQCPQSATAEDGWRTGGIYGWTSGFFPGSLWYAWEYTGDDRFRTWAEERTAVLEPLKDYTGTHDLGFMMYCSYGNGLRLTGREDYRDILMTTAWSLASRYTRTAGVIRSWDFNQEQWRYPVIVDNMMNLELLFWAEKESGQTELSLIAEDHAAKTIMNHIRPDGGTFHVVDYNPDTGEVNEKYTHQGYARDSTWARGQAWGIYGFTMTYRETGDEKYLAAAQKLGDYFISRLPEDAIPYWDFDAPGIPDEPRDSSAAAIAASAFLELSGYGDDAQAKERYRTTAERILTELCSPRYLTEGTANPAILQHATGNKPANGDIDVSLIYGDYYFIEALLRYKGI